jgi:hypothetical protein
MVVIPAYPERETDKAIVIPMGLSQSTGKTQVRKQYNYVRIRFEVNINKVDFKHLVISIHAG